MLEPRFFPRASLDFAVAFDVGTAHPCEGRLVNLSEGGLLAELPLSYPVGAIANVKIAIPGRTNWFATSGKIVRADACEPAGRFSVALMFEDLSDEDADLIREVVGRTDTISWADEGTPIPREVAVRFVPMIRRIARSIACRLPAHVSIDDLVGGGFVAFVELYAKNRHLPEDELDRLAKARIRGAMLDELRGADPLTRRMRQRERAISVGRKEIESKLGRAATHAEVSDHLALSPESYARVMCASHASRVTSLDANGELDVEDETSRGPEHIAQRTEAIGTVRTALEALPPRLRRVLELHYGEDLTLRAIGNILGVSEARISQLISDAVGRLRASCVSQPPPSSLSKPASRGRRARHEPQRL